MEWICARFELSRLLNEMWCSRGVHAFDLFVLNRAVVAKLHFIHCVVRETQKAGKPL